MWPSIRGDFSSILSISVLITTMKTRRVESLYYAEGLEKTKQMKISYKVKL